MLKLRISLLIFALICPCATLSPVNFAPFWRAVTFQWLTGAENKWRKNENNQVRKVLSDWQHALNSVESKIKKKFDTDRELLEKECGALLVELNKNNKTLNFLQEAPVEDTKVFVKTLDELEAPKDAAWKQWRQVDSKIKLAQSESSAVLEQLASAQEALANELKKTGELSYKDMLSLIPHIVTIEKARSMITQTMITQNNRLQSLSKIVANECGYSDFDVVEMKRKERELDKKEKEGLVSPEGSVAQKGAMYLEALLQKNPRYIQEGARLD